MKIQYTKELQKSAYNHSIDTDFKGNKEMYRYSMNKSIHFKLLILF